MNTPISSAACRLLDRVHDAGGELAPLRAGGLVWATVLATIVRQVREAEIAERFAEVTLAVAPWRCGSCGRSAELPDLCTTCYRATAAFVAAGGQFVVGRARYHAASAATMTACGLAIAGAPRVPLATVHRDATICRRCLGSLLRRHSGRLA